MPYFLETGRFKINTEFKLKEKNQEINDKINVWKCI